MKGIVPLSVILSISIGLVCSEAGSKDEQTKQSYSANAIGSSPKPDLLSYQQITQHYGRYQPQQIVYQHHYQPRTQLQQALPYNHQPEPTRKPYMVPQHQQGPVAMVIIAQPAYVPASMLQHGNVAQQLLQYFQAPNSQTQNRYQYIPANHQPVYQQPHQVQTQQIPQYVQYQPQQEITTYQRAVPTTPTTQAPTLPTAQAQTSQTQFYPHEALPTPQALVSQQHHIASHHLNQPSISEGRALQYQQPQQQVDYQPQELQQVEQQVDYQTQQTEYQTPEISRLAQQAAQHFISNGGLNSESRLAPAIITGLEHFSPEQQEKIKAQLSAHFGSPLKPLNLEGNENNQAHEKPIPSRKYYQDHRHRIKSEKFVPSIQVKDGEIRQTFSSGEDKI